jgi:beta-phosphoglucomutase family hydrolase
MSLRAYLFDLDGVITRTSVLHEAAWKQAFEERGFDFGAHDYDEYVDGKLREAGARAFLEARGEHPSDDEVRAISTRKNEILNQLLRRRRVETYPGSLRYLREVRSRGAKTAVVSSSKNAAAVLDSAGIADLFDARVDGTTAAERGLRGKPAPDTFLEAARQLDVAPSEAVVFEDALAGVAAGRAGHFGLVVGVDRANQADALREHGADLVVEDLAELAS